MQQVDFFSLNRPIQERFIDAAHARGAPMPILVARPAPPLAAIGWAAGALGTFAVWIMFLGLGYGDLTSSLAIAPTWTIAVHVVLLALSVWLGFKARKVWMKQRSLPYLPTVYLFPIGVIDARANRFVSHELSELVDVAMSGSGITLRFASGASFDFPVPQERRAEAVTIIEAHRDKIRSLPPDSRERELVLLDPLRDNGFSNPFAPAVSLLPPSNKGWYKEPLLAVVLGAVLGVAAFSVRNVFSEAQLYTQARVENTTTAYRDYLERGGERADVRDILLPRSELIEAQKKGSVDAIEAYIAAHPDSKIGPEVEGVLRGTLLQALEDAKKAGTLAALNEFEKRYGHHKLVDAEVEKARRDHLVRVLEAFRKQSNGDPELLEFAKKLVKLGAKKGSRVVVYFRRRLPSTLEDSEKQLTKSSYFGGVVTLPSKYFNAATSKAREERYGKEIVERLQQAFPAEIAHFELGPTVEDASEELPKVDVPTLLLTYRHELSGAYISRKPRAAFAGVGIFVKAHFLLPGDDQQLSFKYTGWHAPDVKRIEAGELELPGVYEDLVDKAFKKFLKKYWSTWFQSQD